MRGGHALWELGMKSSGLMPPTTGHVQNVVPLKRIMSTRTRREGMEATKWIVLDYTFEEQTAKCIICC